MGLQTMLLINLLEAQGPNFADEFLQRAFDQFKHLFMVKLNPWCALQLAHEQHLTVNNCPQLKTFLEEYKVSLIQSFLQSIKNGSDSAQIVKIMTQRLIDTEIGWRELQILNRSATAIWDEHIAKLNESWSPSKRQEQARALLTDLDELLTSDKTHFQRFDDILDSLVNTVSGRVFDAAMNRRKDKVLVYLNRSFNDEYSQNWYSSIKTFIEYVTPVWPELIKIINSHKTVVIKLILTQIRNLHFHAARRNITLLTHFDINWPEFAIIMKSLDANKNTVSEEIKASHNANQILMVQQLLQSKRTDGAIDSLDYYGLTIDNCPGLEKLLTRYKSQIITALLRGFRNALENNFGFTHIIDYVQYLKTAGFEWAELATIVKSVEYEQDKKYSLNEVADYDDEDTIEEEDYNVDEDFKRVKHLFKIGQWVYAVEEIKTFRLTVDNCAGLAELLNKYKSTLIKLILNTVKLNLDVGRTIYYELKYTKMLIATGIGWSELESIRKSLQTTYDRTANVN